MMQIDAPEIDALVDEISAIDELLDEIGRYLDALDVFRHEGCEPSWMDASVPAEVLR